MSTATEFMKSGIRGQTFIEIRDRFGSPLGALADQDAIMFNYALGFAWVREREHLAVPAAYDKAMNMTTSQVEALFDDEAEPTARAEADFDSQPRTTTP